MRILAVDTSSERGSICVMDGREVVGEVRLASSLQHSERLFGSIEFIFRFLNFQLKDVDLFAAARGPGSFTGLRIGMAGDEYYRRAAIGGRFMNLGTGNKPIHCGPLPNIGPLAWTDKDDLQKCG